MDGRWEYENFQEASLEGDDEADAARAPAGQLHMQWAAANDLIEAVDSSA